MVRRIVFGLECEFFVVKTRVENISREPHNVIAFPMDVSRMTDIEQQRIRMMRTGEKIKPGITIDVSIDDDDDSVGDEVFELKKKRTRK